MSSVFVSGGLMDKRIDGKTDRLHVRICSFVCHPPPSRPSVRPSSRLSVRPSVHSSVARICMSARFAFCAGDEPPQSWPTVRRVVPCGVPCSEDLFLVILYKRNKILKKAGLRLSVCLFGPRTPLPACAVCLPAWAVCVCVSAWAVGTTAALRSVRPARATQLAAAVLECSAPARLLPGRPIG
jgi:hypothetical protein